MIDDRNSYGSILKAISLFGGVKIFQILVGVVKNKVIAVLLGPIGMGIAGMFTSTTSMISTFTGLGLSTSTVREISSAYASGDNMRIGRVVSILRVLVWATGLLGVVLTLILARQLSVWSFGNEKYTIAFRVLSVILLLDQLTIGQTALMQGTFNYKKLAKSSLYGSLIGLVVSLPLYYLYGAKAIVPVMIVTSLSLLLISWLYSRQISLSHEMISIRDVFTEGKTMIVLGIVLALTSFFRLGGTYAQRAFISNYGNIADVGMYMAGASIASQYIDVILNAMSTDYSPRLAAIYDNNLFVETINRQIKLMVTLVMPFIILFIVLSRELILLLYSSEFLQIVGMIELMMFSMMFRAISWCLSFSFVAKGESKIFFLNEGVCTIYSLVFSVLGYYFVGFVGLGIAFLVSYLVYSIQMYILAKRTFKFSFNLDCLSLSIKQICILIVSFASIIVTGESYIRYIVGAIIMTLVCLISYRDLNKMIPIKKSLLSVINKFKNK